MEHRADIATRRKAATERSNLAYDLLLVQSPQSTADNKNVLHQLLRMASLRSLHEWRESFEALGHDMSPTVWAAFERHFAHQLFFDEFFQAALAERATARDAAAEAAEAEGGEEGAGLEEWVDDVGGRADVAADVAAAKKCAAATLRSVMGVGGANPRARALLGAALMRAARDTADDLAAPPSARRAASDGDPPLPKQAFLDNFKMPNDLAASLAAWRTANEGVGAAVDRDLEERAAEWCDDRTTRGRTESCGDVVLGAFESAIGDLAKRRSGSTAEWKWVDFIYRYILCESC